MNQRLELTLQCQKVILNVNFCLYLFYLHVKLRFGSAKSFYTLLDNILATPAELENTIF